MNLSQAKHGNILIPLIVLLEYNLFYPDPQDLSIFKL